MSNHTPGPWRTMRRVTQKSTISIMHKGCGFGLESIAKVHSDSRYEDWQHGEANARLISAAPKMYEFIRKKSFHNDPGAAAIIKEIEGEA